MLIIDRNRDFYDHFSNIYGVDKKVVFDRRGSVRITDASLVELFTEHRGLSLTGFFLVEAGTDQYIIEISNIKYSPHYVEGGVAYSLYGYFQSCDMELRAQFHEGINLFGRPLAISPIRPKLRWLHNYKGQKAVMPTSFTELLEILPAKDCTWYNGRYLKETPILAATSLTKILDPFELWKSIQMHISSLNTEKCVDIAMTDVAKAETHGFDKQSFRHPIK